MPTEQVDDMNELMTAAQHHATPILTASRLYIQHLQLNHRTKIIIPDAHTVWRLCFEF